MFLPDFFLLALELLISWRSTCKIFLIIVSDHTLTCDIFQGPPGVDGDDGKSGTRGQQV